MFFNKGRKLGQMCRERSLVSLLFLCCEHLATSFACCFFMDSVDFIASFQLGISVEENEVTLPQRRLLLL